MKKLVYILLFRHSMKSTTLYENILYADSGFSQVSHYVGKKQEEKTTESNQAINRIHINSLLTSRLIPTIYNITGEEELRLIRTKNNNRSLTDTEKMAINAKYPVRCYADKISGWKKLIHILLCTYAGYGFYQDIKSGEDIPC